MEVAITGANGLVGRAITSELDHGYFKVREIDLPATDVSDYEQLYNAVAGSDAIIHLAWSGLLKNVATNQRDPVNVEMARYAYYAAVESGIKRVIVGSSNQAHGDTRTDVDGKIRISTPDDPINEYGREKLEIEAMGKNFSEHYELDIIALRIGNVNKADRPKPTDDGRPQRWLSKRDLGSLVTKCLLAPEVPGGFQIVYGVSNGSPFDYSNPFGYVPRDSA